MEFIQEPCNEPRCGGYKADGTGFHLVPVHTMADWQYEVANGDTVLGYWQWVKHKREADKSDAVVL